MIELAVRLARAAFTLDVDCRLGAAATGVFGHNGAGKSTLLHAVAGLARADAQRLVVDGHVLDEGARRTPVHRRGVAVVFQDHRLFPHLSVEGNLRYGLKPGPTGFAEVVALLELAPLLARRPAQCSGGERQRVALGRALLSQPRLLLLDEPLVSLDRGLKRQILPFLRRLRHHCPAPILHVSHDLDELLAVTDELVLLERGRVVAQGPLPALAARPEALALLHDLGLVNALPATVAAHDDADGLSWLTLAGPAAVRIAVARCAFPVGSAVEALLRPADVVLARGEPGAVSLNGRAAGVVASIASAGPERVLVGLDVGATTPLLAEIVARGLRTLELAPGAPVLALWKAQAVQVRAR